MLHQLLSQECGGSCDVEQLKDAWPVSGGARVSDSSAHSSTRANGFTADTLSASVCVGLVIKGQTEYLWRVLADRVQKGQRVSGCSVLQLYNRTT